MSSVHSAPRADQRAARASFADSMCRLAALALAGAWLLVTVFPSSAAAASREGDEADSQPRAVFSDRIDVVRLTVDVRVVTGMGLPIEGLDAADFAVRLDGKRADVEAVDWIAEAPAASAPRPPTSGAPVPPLLAAPPPPVQRRVFFMQAPWRASHQIGHLRLRRKLRDMVRELPADAVAAVVAFDSHLKLHQDFTDDRELLMAALDKGRGFHPVSRQPPPPPGPQPSLARYLDPQAARRAAFPADGLELVARALAAEPGPSSIVWVGWGLKRVSQQDYTRLVRTLLYAETPVFILDVTDADEHTLAFTLRQLASDTGGQYFKTRDHPGREVHRVENLLQRGFYRLTVICPPLAPGGYPLQVRLRHVDGYRRVLAPRHAWIHPLAGR